VSGVPDADDGREVPGVEPRGDAFGTPFETGGVRSGGASPDDREKSATPRSTRTIGPVIPRMIQVFFVAAGRAREALAAGTACLGVAERRIGVEVEEEDRRGRWTEICLRSSSASWGGKDFMASGAHAEQHTWASIRKALPCSK
jgi:hypothetical protein